MKRPYLVLALDCLLMAVVVLPLFLIFGPKAEAYPSPSSVLRNDSYTAKEAERYSIFCDGEELCLTEQLEARKKFMQLDRRARNPEPRWSNYNGWVNAPYLAIKVGIDARQVLKQARLDSVVPIKDDYVVDYKNALALAENGLWHLGFEMSDECWMVGEIFPEDGYYNCYDYGQLRHIFPGIKLIK